VGVLRRIFAPRRDEVTGDWRKLHNVGFLFSKCDVTLEVENAAQFIV
jgi:hypothetical protein